MILTKVDAVSFPALFSAKQDTSPASWACIPFTIKELERLSIRNRPEVFSIRSFRNHETSGVGNPRTWHTTRTIKPSTTRRYWPILTTASSIAIPVTRPVDFSIWGFSEAVNKKIKTKKCMNLCFPTFYMFSALPFVNSKDKTRCKSRRLNTSSLNNDTFLISSKCRLPSTPGCGNDWKIILN